MILKSQYAAAAVVALTALTLSAAFDSADARTRRVQGQIATQRGEVSVERQTTRERGLRNRESQVTGPNGRTRTVEDERRWSRENSAYSRDRTVTGAGGAERTVVVDAMRTGEGQYSVSREVTGRNGETRMQSGDFTRARTENGVSVSGGIATTHQGQVQYQRDVTRGNGQRSAVTSTTYEDGASRTRATDRVCADQSCTTSSALATRQGRTRTSEHTRTRTEDGATLERDTTYNDGSTRSVDRERVGNGDGAGAVTRTVTDRAGRTRTQTGTYEVEPNP